MDGDFFSHYSSAFGPSVGSVVESVHFNSPDHPSTSTGPTIDQEDFSPDVINPIGLWENSGQQASRTSDYATIPAFVAENSKGSESMFDLCNIFDNWSIGAHIKNQSKVFVKTNCDPELLAKGIRRQAFGQLLEAFDEAISFDHKRWISSRLIHALDDIDDLTSQQIEAATEKIESTEDIEENIRFRKVFCKNYPNGQRTRDQNMALLFPKNRESRSKDFSAKMYDSLFPVPHQIIAFGSQATNELFRNINRFPMKDVDKQTLLHAAAAKGNVNLLKMFLDQDLKVDARDPSGRTPAFVAASLGHVDALEILHSHGAHLSYRDCHGTSLLEIATMRNHVLIIWKLKTLGYDFKEKAMNRDSPLTIAAAQGYYDAAYALVRCGVDLSYRSSGGTAAEVARNKFPLLADYLFHLSQQ
ncbi:MAG: hypothetical protein Q9167_005098 [Letrouitia subvulpina]